MYSYSYYSYGGTDMAAFWVGYAVFMSLFVVYSIVCIWRIFSKAGRPGWHSLIPFLNIYDLLLISWRRKKAKTCITLTIIAISMVIIGFILILVSVGTGVGVAVGRGLSGRSDILDGLVHGAIGVIIAAVIYLAAMVLSIIILLCIAL